MDAIERANKEARKNCNDCRFSCSLAYTGEFCEDCLQGYCILCMNSHYNTTPDCFEKDTEVTKYIKKENLDSDFVRALYRLNENILNMNLKEFKKLIKLLNSIGGKE